MKIRIVVFQLFTLPNLRTLWLNENAFQAMPGGISKLRTLEYLSMYQNRSRSLTFFKIQKTEIEYEEDKAIRRQAGPKLEIPHSSPGFWGSIREWQRFIDTNVKKKYVVRSATAPATNRSRNVNAWRQETFVFPRNPTGE